MAQGSRNAAVAVALGLALFGVYSANRRAIGAGDTVPATLLPVALLRGDGPFLDRFDRALRTADGRLPGYLDERRGRIVSRYPIGPALVALPFVLPQLAWLDRVRPDWESQAARRECSRMGKHAAAAIAAVFAVALFVLLGRMGLGRVALPATLAAALGSGLWPVASQAPWQHGPASLGLTLALLLLHDPAPSRRRLMLAGLATALIVACRPIDVVFAATITLWVARRFDRPDRLAFFAPAGAAGVALASYHLWFFGTLSGGYAAIERMHPWAHGTRGTFTGPLLAGAAGTLVSPSHGLFVYSPWALLALAALPRSGGPPRGSLARWLLWALAPNLVLLAKYSCWWGGHCFGARFWIDALPVLAIALAHALESARARRLLRLGFAATIAVSVAIQGIGAFTYPTTWHGSPTNADRDHARLWDWHDNEVTRGLAEGVKPPAW